ncbi:endonuclease [Limnohabitans sp.]|uniref:endonuclease n=1 Tax=Limnohabitans sp. TaxID=1907725 RepID=UPI00286EE6DE|nr:endonuclease [Limnohabitans sp.]
MTHPSVTEHKIDPASLAALPRTPGVYIFKGEGTLPLYIGKSVDIRSRVMSHLRAPDEASMIAQTRRIDFVETAGEIGALLLESRMIKEQSPLFNQRLRRVRTLCSIRLTSTDKGNLPEVVDSKSVNLGETAGLYGLFSSDHAAKAMLKELSQQHRLCMSVLGLEKTSARGCFGLQIKTCLGACVGKEDRHTHDQRLLSALVDSQVEVWPFSGPIDVIEESDGWVQRHRVNNWCYLGTQCSKVGTTSKLNAFKQNNFDLDSYKILVKPIMLKTVKVETVDP